MGLPEYRGEHRRVGGLARTADDLDTVDAGGDEVGRQIDILVGGRFQRFGDRTARAVGHLVAELPSGAVGVERQRGAGQVGGYVEARERLAVALGDRRSGLPDGDGELYEVT